MTGPSLWSLGASICPLLLHLAVLSTLAWYSVATILRSLWVSCFHVVLAGPSRKHRTVGQEREEWLKPEAANSTPWEIRDGMVGDPPWKRAPEAASPHRMKLFLLPPRCSTWCRRAWEQGAYRSSTQVSGSTQDQQGQSASPSCQIEKAGTVWWLPSQLRAQPGRAWVLSKVSLGGHEGEWGADFPQCLQRWREGRAQVHRGGVGEAAGSCKVGTVLLGWWQGDSSATQVLLRQCL